MKQRYGCVKTARKPVRCDGSVVMVVRFTATSLLILAILCVAVWPTSAFARGDDPPTNVDAQEALESFLSALAANDPKRAYEYVAPETKKKGDPIAYRAKVDYDSFVTEVDGQPAKKFGAFKLGKQRADGKDTWRIWVHFE